MRRGNPAYQRSTHLRRGYGLLALLVALAIGMIVYYLSVVRVQMALKVMQGESPDDYPWVQDGRIKDPTKHEIGPPSELQLQVTEPMEIQARVTAEDAQRGQLNLVLYPDGMVSGYWSGRYFPPTAKEHEVMAADVRGNIDPTNIYEDQNGPDPSKLYFITKGDFLILEARNDGRMRRMHGEIYVTGWFDNDMSAHGELHITSDRKTQSIFTWRAGPGQPMKDPIFGR